MTVINDRNIFSEIGKVLPLDLLIKLTRSAPLLPFYHTVLGDYSLPHIRHLYKTISFEQFKKDIEWISCKYEPVTLEEFEECSRSGSRKSKRPCFLLTFDDGLRELHEFVMPYLFEKGIPATVFINSAFVDNKDIFYRYLASVLASHLEENLFSATTLANAGNLFERRIESASELAGTLLSARYLDKHLLIQAAELLDFDIDHFLSVQRPYLTLPQLKEMQEHGFTVGAHSIDHPMYSDLSVENQLHQTLTSLEFLNDQLFGDRSAFSFPFSDVGVSREFFSRLALEEPAPLVFGGQGFKYDEEKSITHRHAMEDRDCAVETFVKGKYVHHLVQRLVGRARVNRV